MDGCHSRPWALEVLSLKQFLGPPSALPALLLLLLGIAPSTNCLLALSPLATLLEALGLVSSSLAHGSGS